MANRLTRSQPRTKALPTDSKGKFHRNFQTARAADRMSAADSATATDLADRKVDKTPDKPGAATTLSDNGDGSFHTDGPGGSMDHPALGHALMHIASTHEGGVHTTDGPSGKWSVDDSGEVKEGDEEEPASPESSDLPPSRHHGSLTGF
jgi:hypothetical protein